MKLAIGLYISLFTLVILADKSYSLTDLQIKKVCKNEKKKLTCIKNLQEKRTNLQKGNYIEIPVIPFRR